MAHDPHRPDLTTILKDHGVTDYVFRDSAPEGTQPVTLTFTPNLDTALHLGGALRLWLRNHAAFQWKIETLSHPKDTVVVVYTPDAD